MLLDVPADRTAPAHVAEGLRAVDPTAVLHYAGDGLWLLGSVRPNALARAQAEAMLARSAAAGVSDAPRGVDQLARLVRQGFRPIGEYQLQGEPTSAVVHDFRRRDWQYRHWSDAEVFAAMDAPDEAARAAARADLTDPARARDLWRTHQTLSHLVDRRHAAALSSARTRHLTLP